MDLGIAEKVALVAAASSGLGKATARRLAQEGARVAICSRHAGRIRQAAEEIAAETGATVLPVVADLTRAEEIQHFVSTATAELGPPLILVTNTGGPPAGSPLSFSDEVWWSAFNQVFFSALRLIRLTVPHMEAAGWGRIVNITSISVKQPIDTLVLSNATRAALVALAKTLSTALASKGITVNNVGPGPIATPRIEELMEAAVHQEGISPEEARARWAAPIPMQRLGRPEELADVIAFLCSERASFITGVTIQVDGGMTKGLF
ncbi:MAG: SDR family oxidoreductase [Ardenticatenia bacterium]|nr:SDR family oxidoreductase [Ardenticatenia bacterium]